MPMQKIKAFIPHLFTLGNLFCGCMGIIYAFAWKLDWAAYMVFLAAFLDFFDGFFARILKVPSELGKQLDSLADMVSFGVVPGIVMFQWLRYLSWQGLGTRLHEINYLTEHIEVPWYCYVALLIPLFSCYRLAKFNLDTRQSHGFIGLPTPANAIFFVSMVLIVTIAHPFLFDYAFAIYPPLSEPFGEYTSTSTHFGVGDPHSAPNAIIGWDGLVGVAFNDTLLQLLINKYFILVLIVIFSFLLVAELPLFALKFKNFGWNDNKIRYIFLGLCAALLICFWLTAIPFIVILYLLLSIINNIFKLTV